MHEYAGSFQGQSARFKMTSVCGHVMSLDFIGGYRTLKAFSFPQSAVQNPKSLKVCSRVLLIGQTINQ